MAKRRKSKKRKHVRVTAPDFGAVFDAIAREIDDACETVVNSEKYEFYNRLVEFIRKNEARPEDETVFELRKQGPTSTGRSFVHFRRYIPRHTIENFKSQERYQRRKEREGYGTTHLIRTGTYLDSIVKWHGSRKSASGTAHVALVDVEKRNHPISGIHLPHLAKLLEYGFMKPVRRTRIVNGKTQAVTNFLRIAARPHWRPTLLWYRATRVKQVRSWIGNLIMSRIKTLSNWRTKR